MQKLAEVQDTEVRLPPGMACSAQAVPFHISAPPPVAAGLDPTASQKTAETQDTPVKLIRTPLTAGTGSGVFCSCQVAPFHISARATLAALESRCEPTASQKTAETQDTPLRLLVTEPRGDTARWICHELPFQDSARASCPLVLVSWKFPAVSHAVTAVHDTWLRLVADAAAGFGVSCTVQEVPFQVRPRLTVFPELLVWLPTASQNAAVTQDTPARLADPEPGIV
jgi:hypothetical protein